MRERSRLSTGSLQYHHVSPKQNGTIDMGELATDTLPQSFHKAVLYVLGEKNQLKVHFMASFSSAFMSYFKGENVPKFFFG